MFVPKKWGNGLTCQYTEHKGELRNAGSRKAPEGSRAPQPGAAASFIFRKSDLRASCGDHGGFLRIP